MKKLLFLSVFCGILISCSVDPKPIEKYKGKGYVVTEEPLRFYSEGDRLDLIKLKVKSKDTLVTIYIPEFDGKNLKVGDTIK